MRRTAAIAVVALLAARPLAAGPPEGGAAAPVRLIAYAGDVLTVRLTKVPITEVLEEIGRQSGAAIVGDVRDPRDVSAEFDAVPLAEALHRLLGTQNFALVYGEGDRLRALRLFGGAPATASAAGLVTVGVSTTTTIAPTEGGGLAGLMAAVDAHQAIPISGRLAQVLGTDAATFRQLIELGMHHEDPGVRAEAVRSGLQVIENEPGFRATILGAVNGLDEASMVAILRGSAGERAEEIAMHVATQSRVAELRTKASSVLQKLRSGG